MKSASKSRSQKKEKNGRLAKSTSANPNNGFPIVGIGASAGGLEAFLQLFSGMPVDTGMAFVLIQHLDPTHPSMSAEIISRSTKLEIEEVKDGTRVKPNHVYVIPPNHKMGILDGVLHLSARNETPGQNMTIDFFLQSLAKSEKCRAIGVVLSGTGSDGTNGLTAIKAEGGVTYVQDPKSAKFQGMPKSAIQAGVTDMILRPEEIAKELSRIATHPYLASQETFQSRGELSEDTGESVISDETQEPSRATDDLYKIFGLLRAHSKIDFTNYKHTTIKRRIQRRMMVHRTKSFHEYTKYLEAHHDEMSSLYNDILINVTDFFRDPESFKSITSQVLPSLLKNRSPRESIRIWVPGCSTGEEVYSIAIVLLEYLNDAGKQNPIQIFATDISERAIQKARLGLYPEGLTRNISKGRLKRFFEKVEGGYKIQKSVRDLCLFSRHDVTSDPPFAKLDLISCRNLLIYFAPILQKQVIPIFHYALQPGGFLWLGKSENPGEFSKLFSVVEKTQKIYSKANTPTPLNFRFPAKRAQESPEATKNAPTLTNIRADFQKDADKIILAKFAPPSIIVNADFEILQFRGRTVPFLEPATGQPSLNLLKMARPELLASLRTTILTVKKENKPARRLGLHLEADGKQITVDIEVLPTNPLVPSKDRTYLVLFRQVNEAKQIPRGRNKQAQYTSDTRISELLKELSEIKDYQRSLIEQYETTQEELTSANEELQSTNEEFQSTNEEIETAKEELQSTNEELVALNDELQIRNADLTTLGSDLNNLLASIELPVLMVGSDHNIRRFSPKAKDLFNLIPTDIARPISDIKPKFALDLDALVSEVLERLSPKEIEVQDLNGTWLRIQIRPYRSVDNKIDGAVIAVVDVDALKKKEIKAKETIEYITSVAETVPLPLSVVAFDFRLQSANQPFYKYFQISNKSVGKDIFSFLKMKSEDLEKVRKLFSRSISENKLFTDFEISCEIPNIGSRKVLLSGGKIGWIGTEKDAALISFVDVTEQRRLEENTKLLLANEKDARSQADKANEAKDVFLATLSHELRTPLSSILTWAQLIGQGKVDFEKAKQGAAVIEQCAKTQSHLIDDLIDVSRIISGKLALEVENVDSATAIRTAVDSVRPMAEKKSIQIIIDLCTESVGKSMLVRVDPTRFQQIIWNILTNAVKFSPERGVISVQLRNVGEETQHFAQFKVSDHGKGIPPQFLPHIFSRFSQADSASNRVHGGLGLGLSIVQNLVELQGGTITAENAKKGGGAVFTVTFPVIPQAAHVAIEGDLSNGKKPLESTKIIGQPNLEGLRILFVDDDESAREATGIFLKTFGAEVMAVGSAKEALATLPKFKPHILVSDIAMPGEDGYSLIRKIRRLHPDRGGDVPALALTAYATPEDSEHALTSGFQAHIAKPVEANELGRAILKVSGKTNLLS
jgi:two-component system CheB/CheR fusion protein